MNNVDELDDYISGSLLQDLKVVSLSYSGINKSVFVLQVEPTKAFQSWQYLRDIHCVTDRWPLIVSRKKSHGDWFNDFERYDFSSRDPFLKETCHSTKPHLPLDIIERSTLINLTQFLRLRDMEFSDYLNEYIQRVCFYLKEKFGFAPSLEALLSAKDHGMLSSWFKTNFWISQWIDGKFQLTLQNDAFIRCNTPSFSDGFVSLFLIPTKMSYESLAFIQWRAAKHIGSDVCVRLLKHWQNRYGAELISHSGNALYFQVNYPPKTLAEAVKVLGQHYAISAINQRFQHLTFFEEAYQLINQRFWILQ